MNVNIRPMTENDTAAVAEISSLSFSAPWSKDSYAQEIKNPVSLYLVAIIEDKIIGFIGTWNVLDESHITNVAVHPDYRQLKIGSLLLESLINVCQANYNTTFFDLEVRQSNIPAQKLYSKYNFVKNGIRKGYYADNKEDAVLMCRISK